MTSPFDLPPTAACSASPKWDGQNFVFGGQCASVFEHSESFSGWSDDLTLLHEEAAGGSQAIDCASRNDAARLLGNLIAVGFKICRRSHLGFVLFPAFAVVKLLIKRSPFGIIGIVVWEQSARAFGSGLVRLVMEFESKDLSDIQFPFWIRALMTVQRPA